MKIETLHIVSLDVPIPADYGGVIDIYYRTKAIKDSGVKVILHCFEYGRTVEGDFSEIADEVYFYKRKKSIIDNLKSEPFIVTSRKSEELVTRLLLDQHPILMEGHHCAGLLSDPRLSNRKKFVRVHNIEWMYYKALSHSVGSTWRKLFFKSESKKLKKFDDTLRLADALFCLNDNDLAYYKDINPASYLWPVGCSVEKESTTSTQNYALFHGNLSVIENEKALRWIIQVWQANNLNFPLIVAGKNPKSDLKKLLQKCAFVELISNPSHQKMNSLIAEAEVNLLITFQSTGVKLKLINALVQGKRCIANPLMVEGMELGQFCDIIDNETELVAAIKDKKEISSQDIEARMEYINRHFNANENAKRALEIIENKIN